MKKIATTIAGLALYFLGTAGLAQGHETLRHKELALQYFSGVQVSATFQDISDGNKVTLNQIALSEKVTIKDGELAGTIRGLFDQTNTSYSFNNHFLELQLGRDAADRKISYAQSLGNLSLGVTSGSSTELSGSYLNSKDKTTLFLQASTDLRENNNIGILVDTAIGNGAIYVAGNFSQEKPKYAVGAVLDTDKALLLGQYSLPTENQGAQISLNAFIKF